MTEQIIVIGGGAAGFFGAIQAAASGKKVTILEKTRKSLSKVKISGGGRCNVTHACFDPQKLVQNYPRGANQLRGPFTRFQPKDTIDWFEARGVELKTEDDGRMFPITDSSQTIIDCLMHESAKLGIDIRYETGLDAILPQESGFQLKLTNGSDLVTEKLLIATGSTRPMLQLLQTLGHTIVPCVPSLFTFNIKDFSLKELAGVSVEQARLKVLGLERTGPMLITHWGFSGPAVLKLSAFGARLLHDSAYKAELVIDWQSSVSFEAKQKKLQEAKELNAKKQVNNACPYDIPNSLWCALLASSAIDPTKRFADLSRREMEILIDRLHRMSFQIDGQTTYKEEFVTCGGVTLDEVNFKTMESKIVPGLFFAGEVLDIDGVTGGFNFQNAWTTGWIAGSALQE